MHLTHTLISLPKCIQSRPPAHKSSHYQTASAMLRVTIPPLTKAVLAFSTVVSVVVGIIRYSAYFALSAAKPGKQIEFSSIFVSYLTVVPAQSIVFPWAFFTAAYVELNLLSLVATLATLFYGARYCERVWGSRELAKFLLLVSSIPNFVVFIIFIVAFVITKNANYQFTTISGGLALQSGFLVAFKQLVPEHTIVLFRGIIKIRVKHLPALYLLTSTVFGFLGQPVNALLSWSGFFTAWIYLRFYRTLVSGGEFLPPPVTAGQADSGMANVVSTRGDASDTFSMANFFPDAIAPVISFISNRAFAFLVSIRLCTPFSQQDIETSNLRNGQFRQRFVAPLPGSVRAEAERRRALALKALDQRLSQVKKESGGLGETNFVPDDTEG
ncbi:eukaryotic integral membrane protein-domain-containing protein [Lipomyces arxii]|uniref:eukaryotic integral membrane protein-domain-containing protein n=1 Tax=Lipomyces arxii TaxID=56418 RepID=UPI0034CE0895